jgi:hypothetical protein
MHSETENARGREGEYGVINIPYKRSIRLLKIQKIKQRDKRNVKDV